MGAVTRIEPISIASTLDPDMAVARLPGKLVARENESIPKPQNLRAESRPCEPFRNMERITHSLFKNALALSNCGNNFSSA